MSIIIACNSRCPRLHEIDDIIVGSYQLRSIAKWKEEFTEKKAFYLRVQCNQILRCSIERRKAHRKLCHCQRLKNERQRRRKKAATISTIWVWSACLWFAVSPSTAWIHRNTIYEQRIERAHTPCVCDTQSCANERLYNERNGIESKCKGTHACGGCEHGRTTNDPTKHQISTYPHNTNRLRCSSIPSQRIVLYERYNSSVTFANTELFLFLVSCCYWYFSLSLQFVVVF